MYQRRSAISLAALIFSAALISNPAVSSASTSSYLTPEVSTSIHTTLADADSAFLAMIHSAGIIAPDGQAIEVGRRIASLDRSGASYDTMYNAVRSFGVYDYHVDAFIQAARAAYK